MTTDDLARDARDIRLLLATLDGDEQRADQVLDEDPGQLSPRVRAAYKRNAIEVAEQMEAEHGRDTARRMLEADLLRVDDQAEEHRDPVGHIWRKIRFDDIADDIADGDDDATT